MPASPIESDFDIILPMRNPDIPEGLRYKVAYAQVAVDNESQSWELTRSVADDFSTLFSLRWDHVLQRHSLHSGKGGSQTKVKFDASGHGMRLCFIKTYGILRCLNDVT
mgnify:CR=1 FL=1|jgi:hypothetical protein